MVDLTLHELWVEMSGKPLVVCCRHRLNTPLGMDELIEVNGIQRWKSTSSSTGIDLKWDSLIAIIPGKCHQVHEIPGL